MKALEKRILCLLLASCLFCALPLPVLAEEAEDSAGEPVSESTPSAGDTIPETSESPVTQTIPETTPPPVEPLSETTVSPGDTADPMPSEDLAAEESAPVLFTARTAAVLTIAEALALPADYDGTFFTVRGTVVLAVNSQVVLQDGSYGMRISFASPPDAVPGDVLDVTCEKADSSFAAVSAVFQGSAGLPAAAETTLVQAPENCRILIKDAVLGDGSISQSGVSLPLTAELPEEAAAGDTMTVTGVVLDGRLYAEQLVKTDPPEVWNTWYAVQPEDIRSADTIALTMTSAEGETFALAWDRDTNAFFTASVRLGTDTMECPDTAVDWTITRDTQGMSLRSSQGWLSCQDAFDGLCLSGSAGYWELADGYLYHPETSRYLALSQEQWRMPLDHRGSAAGQTLRFWRATPQSTATEPSEAENGSLQPYFGQLHAHSNLSDGLGTVEELFQSAANTKEQDFFAITDHSDSFDNALHGAINLDGTEISAEWAAGKAAAASVTSETFVGLFGYEMTWPSTTDLGHINTFCSPGWQSYGQEGFSTLERYYEALASCPSSISQFNHPGDYYGDFEDFSHYDQRYDNVIYLLEVGGENGFTAYDRYTRALDQGWHVAPSNSQSNHNGPQSSDSGARTAVLAEKLSEEDIYDAIRHYRVYATADPDLSISFSVNGQFMGSILTETDAYQLSATLRDPTDSAIGTVEVIADGGEVQAAQTVSTAQAEVSFSLPGGCSYYYLRVTQPDGDIAVTAPIWVEDYANISIESFSCDGTPTQGEEAALTVTLYNQEPADFLVDSLSVFQGETVIYQAENPGTVSRGGTLCHNLSYSCAEAGAVELRTVVTGSVAGISRTYEQTLVLRCQTLQPLSLAALSVVRQGQAGQSYRVKGFVTAGTSNAYNSFPDTIYLQDDTGGIAVTAFGVSGIQVGCPLEITGVLKTQNGNLVLEMLEYTQLPEDYYRYVPRTLSCETATNYAVHGGELLQVEGKVVSLTPTTDGKGISQFVVEDIVGGRATVLIEPYIRSGSTGENTLADQVKLGRTVRAMGLGHLDETGQSVIRVRNCEEVVYVLPLPDRSNPKTGDFFQWLF